MTKPLSQMQRGERGTVTRIDATGPLHRRLIEMGLTVGTEVAVMGFAPLGDPMKLSLQGYRLGLRKEEAQLIVVEQAENGR